jgi:hypothetical protein
MLNPAAIPEQAGNDWSTGFGDVTPSFSGWEEPEGRLSVIHDVLERV